MSKEDLRAKQKQLAALKKNVKALEKIARDAADDAKALEKQARDAADGVKALEKEAEALEKEAEALEKEAEALEEELKEDDELNTSAESDQATMGVVHPENPIPGIDGQTTDGDQGIPNATTMKTDNL